jgi:hypothetical protein
MVKSIFVAFESLDIDDNKAVHMAELFLKTYGEVLQKGKPDYIEQRSAQGIVKNFLYAVSKRKQKDILAKRTTGHKDKLEILLDDPLHIELDETAKHLYRYGIFDSMVRMVLMRRVIHKRHWKHTRKNVSSGRLRVIACGFSSTMIYTCMPSKTQEPSKRYFKLNDAR